jgi:hypothetical protein
MEGLFDCISSKDFYREFTAVHCMQKHSALLTWIMEPADSLCLEQGVGWLLILLLADMKTCRCGPSAARILGTRMKLRYDKLTGLGDGLSGRVTRGR